jgi:hypothetical protein
MLAPFASLALLPVVTWLLAVSPPEAASYPIGYDALVETRKLDDGQRLRAALEIVRWQRGRYPDSLEGLRELSPALLAGIPVDEYSYARTAGGYALDRRLSSRRAVPSGRDSQASSQLQEKFQGEFQAGEGTLALSASSEPPNGETAASSPPSVP